LPTFLAKKEVFDWLKQGKKTIDIRKGRPQQGAVAVFISGPYKLALKIVRVESGQLTDLIRVDNYRQVIPTASKLDDSLTYLRGLYGVYDGIFTAYMVAK